MVHGLLVAVSEGGRWDCPGLIVMAVVEAFVLRCILILWQAQMEVEAAVVMLVLWSLVVMAVVEVFEPR